MKGKETAMLLARFKSDDKMEIGIDETGRGPFFGPIMAGAMMLPPELEWTEEQRKVFIQLRDSKKISPKKRERLADELNACLSTCAVGMVHVNEINDHGIQWANREAFRRAVHSVIERVEEEEKEKQKEEQIRLVIDGTLALDQWKGEQELVIEGDNRYIAVGGASILAKVVHDRWIQDFAKDNPEVNERYDLVGSKGYGTAKHREGIRLYGGHEQHRELFIQRWLPNANTVRVERTKVFTHKKKPTTTCLIRFE